MNAPANDVAMQASDASSIPSWQDRMRDPNREFHGQIDCMADEIRDLRAALDRAIAKATGGAA